MALGTEVAQGGGRTQCDRAPRQAGKRPITVTGGGLSFPCARGDEGPRQGV